MSAIICPKCNKENAEQDIYCWNCGHNLSEREGQLANIQGDQYTEETEGSPETGFTPPDNNSLGVTSLVTGILGLLLAFCCSPLGALLGIVALVCGIVGNGRQQRNAVAGIVLGAISIFLGILLSIFTLPLIFAIFFEAIAEGATGY